MQVKASPSHVPAKSLKLEVCDRHGKIQQISLHPTSPYERKKLCKLWNRLKALLRIRTTVRVHVDGFDKPLYLKVNDLKGHIGNKKTVSGWAICKNPLAVKSLILDNNHEMIINTLHSKAPDILEESKKADLKRLFHTIDYRQLPDIFANKEFKAKKLLTTLITAGRHLESSPEVPEDGISFDELPQRAQYAIRIRKGEVVISKEERQELVAFNLNTLAVTHTQLNSPASSQTTRTPQPSAPNLLQRLFSLASLPKPESSEFLTSVLDEASQAGFQPKQLNSIKALACRVDHKQLLTMLGSGEQEHKTRVLHTYIRIGEQFSSRSGKKYVGRKTEDPHYAFAINGEDVYINTNTFQDKGGFKRITGGYHLNTMNEFVRIKLPKNIAPDKRANEIKLLRKEFADLELLVATNNPHLTVPTSCIIEGKDKYGRSSIVAFQTRYPSNGNDLSTAEVFQQIAGLSGAAKGLAHMHRNGFVHGDFKPGNLLIQGNLHKDTPVEPKISDFGALRRIKEALVQRTTAYLPPEARQVAIATPELDAFALGIVIVETIAPGFPFRSAHPGRYSQAQRDNALDQINAHIRQNRKGLTDEEVEQKVRMLTIARGLLKENVNMRSTCEQAGARLDAI